MKTSHRHRVAFLSISLIVSLVVSGESAPQTGSPVVAVTTFVSRDPALDESGIELLVDLVSQALGTAGVRLAERRNLDAALREQELSLSGITDSSGAIEVGKISGARYVLSGSAYALSGAVFVSARLIDTTSGEVLRSAVRKGSGAWADVIESLASGVAMELAAALPGTSAVTKPNGTAVATPPRVEARWVSDAPARKAGSATTPEHKPVLVYIMSNVEDSVDGQGISWYMGPERLKPVTDAIKRAGLGAVVLDRNLLPSLAKADFSAYSMVFILDGDSNGKVDVKKADQDALFAFYKNGGMVWLSAESESPALDLGDYREDGNALAKPFGYGIGGTVFTTSSLMGVEEGRHPLFGKAKSLAYDAEIGLITGSNPRGQILIAMPPACRLADPKMTLKQLLALAKPDRRALWQAGKQREMDFAWMLDRNFSKIGPEVGPGAACMVMVDERDRGAGIFLLDSGWLLGWAFNGPMNGRSSIGDDIIFIESLSRWASGQ